MDQYRQLYEFPRATSPDGLTAREREVLVLICDGMTSKEIAIALRLSPRTVNRHRDNICQRLRMNSIALMVRWAIRQGMIEP